MKFKLDENLPASSTAILTSAGHDVDTVTQEGLIGAPDRDVVTAATAAGRILISLDRGLGDIRAYPPGSHAGIVVLRLTDQSAAAATKAVTDLATLTNPDSLTGAVTPYPLDCSSCWWTVSARCVSSRARDVRAWTARVLPCWLRRCAVLWG